MFWSGGAEDQSRSVVNNNTIFGAKENQMTIHSFLARNLNWWPHGRYRRCPDITASQIPVVSSTFLVFFLGICDGVIPVFRLKVNWNSTACGGYVVRFSTAELSKRQFLLVPINPTAIINSRWTRTYLHRCRQAHHHQEHHHQVML